MELRARRSSAARGVPAKRLAAAIALVVVLGLTTLVMLWLVSRPTSGVKLRGFPPGSDATVAYAGRFPAAGRPALLSPLGIVTDEERLYVAEADAGCIRVFGLSGEELATITVPVAPGARVAYPVDLALVGQDRIAVVDTAGRRVVVMPTDVRSRSDALTCGSEDASSAPQHPTAVAAFDGDVYVADAGAGEIRVYDESGAYVRSLGGDEQPRLTYVGSLCVLGDTLYVTDANAGRVLAFDCVTGERESVSPQPFTLPRGIAVGPAGRVIVVDTLARTCHILSASGERVDVIDGNTSGDGALSSPRDVAWVGDTGRAYVTDAGTGHVVVFNVRSRGDR